MSALPRRPESSAASGRGRKAPAARAPAAGPRPAGAPTVTFPAGSGRVNGLAPRSPSRRPRRREFGVPIARLDAPAAGAAQRLRHASVPLTLPPPSSMRGNRFHTTLAPVQLLRDREADAARETHGRALRARFQQESAVAEAESALRDRLGLPATTAAAWRFRAEAHHRGAAVAALSDARRELTRLQADEAASRQALANATRRQEAIQDLRASAEADQRADRARRELSALDDIATSRSGRAPSAA